MMMRRFVMLVAVTVSVLVIGAQVAFATGPEEFETLVAPDARGGDRFGWSIAVDGNRVVVGAPWDRLPAQKLGSALVFTRSGLGWKIDKLTPSAVWRKGGGLSSGRQFGFSVDVSGDRVVVGAPGAWIDGVETGGVFLFELIDGEWVETILEPEEVESADGIGRQVRFSEDGRQILISTLKVAPGRSRPGSAYLYELVDDDWVSQQFVASDAENGDEFGSSVGFGDGFIAIGSPNHSSAGRHAGAIYVYEEVDGEWVESKIVSDDPQEGDRIGQWFQVFGEVIIVPDDTFETVLLFRRMPDGWSQEIMDVENPTTPFDGEVPGLFEVGELMLLAEYENTYSYKSTGAIRVLERTETAWVEIDRYEGSEFGEGFGFAFTFLGFEDAMLIAAPWHRYAGNASGVVYVQGVPPTCGSWEPTVVGTNGDDELWGTPGDDVFVPGSGNDLIHVSGGRDIYCLNDGTYRFSGPVLFERSGPEGHQILVTSRVLPEWQMLVAD